ncbi:MAG: hypothetical protein J7621_19575 [Niastella sp.]|nr:hypothetical protein [Niastella sp.]
MKNKCYLRKTLLLLAVMFGISTLSLAQKIGEVLDVGPDHIISGRQKLLLKVSRGKLEYDLWQDEKTRFVPFKDSSLFLSKQSSVVVYIKPMNPLNYSLESSIAFTASPIRLESEAAMESIVSLLTDFVSQNNKDKQKAADEKLKAKALEEANKKNNKKAKAVEAAAEEPACNKIDGLIEVIEKNINPLLKKDQKKQVADLFTALKNINFERQQETREQIDGVARKIEPLETDLGDLKTYIEQLEELISKYDCPNPHPYIVKIVFGELAAKMKPVLKEKTDRLNNLKKCLDVVDKAYKKAAANEEGLVWMIPYEDDKNDNVIEVKKGSTSNYTVIINEAGYKLSDNNEIVTIEKQVKIKATLRIAKFQRFITEVTPGTAYSFLQFPKYGTVTDANGKQTVAEAGTENFKRLSFSAMVNFNYFITHSSVNPFLQIGVGANTDYPAFFTGAGIRFDLGLGTVKAISVSGGIVSSWIKKLNKLAVGDEVSGTAELEKDLTHEFRWPPKPYIGIQLKF